MIRNKKKIYLMVLIMLVVFSGLSMASNIKIKIEDNMLLSESEKKVSLRLEDESGEIIKDDRELMLKVTRGGVLENEYLNKGIELVNGQAEFTYLAPKKLGRSEIVIIDTQTNKSIQKPLIIINRKQLQRHSESGYATITDFEGEVLIKSVENNSWDSAVKGQKLHKDDFIKTQINSWSIITLFDGSEITIEPSTEFKIVNLTGDVNNKQLDQGIFKLIVGKVLNKVNELTGRGSRFEIETDSATAGVRGTYFEVSYQEGENLVRVYEGSVKTEDKSSDRVYVVNEKEEITVAQEVEDSAGEENIQNQIKKHNTTQEEKIKEIEEKKEEIRKIVLENKANANSNINNNSSENNNSGGNSSNSSSNSGSENNNSGGNSSNSSSNSGSENNNSGGNSSNSSSNSGSENNNSGGNSSNSSSNSGSENNNSGGNSSNSSSNSGSENNNSGGNSSNSSSNSGSENNNSGGNSSTSPSNNSIGKKGGPK